MKGFLIGFAVVCSILAGLFTEVGEFGSAVWCGLMAMISMLTMVTRAIIDAIERRQP